MPGFLHFYPGYTHESYQRIPRRAWRDMVQYMNEYMKAMAGGR